MGGRIISLPFDPHRKVQGLLPWYLRGQLEPEEHAQVEDHLAGCPECRADLAFEARLAETLASEPPDPEKGWARMRRRIEDQRGGAPRELPARRRVSASLAAPWLGWAAAACLLVVIAGGGAFLTWTQPDRYHALGAQPAAPAGDLVVIFKPDTPEAVIRELLKTTHARIVDGPTAADAYVLATPSRGRGAALARLRADPALVLAEPVDGAAGP